MIKNTNSDFHYKFDYFPLTIVITYLISLYIVHFFVNDSSSFILFIFLVITNLFIIIGYFIIINKKQYQSNFEYINMNLWNYESRIRIIIIISMIVTIISSINSISAFYYGKDNLVSFILNPGRAYEYVKFLRNNPEYNTTGKGFGSLISIILTLASASKYLYLTLSLIYWKNLNKGIKILFLSTSIVYLIQSMLIGAMINVAGLFMSTIPILINNLRIRRISPSLSHRNMRNKRYKGFVYSIISIVLIVFIIGNRVDENSSFQEGLKTLTFYLTHGFIGLEKAIYLPFEFTFGFTTFRGISVYIVDLLNIYDPFNNSYLIRNEYINGWPSMSLWSTIYPWLASDFTYFGIPFIMGFISYKFGKIWNKTIITNNPFGYVLLGQFFIFWFMIPANNQLFQTLGNSASFISILILYLWSYKRERRYINMINKKGGGN